MISHGLLSRACLAFWNINPVSIQVDILETDRQNLHAPHTRF